MFFDASLTKLRVKKLQKVQKKFPPDTNDFLMEIFETRFWYKTQVQIKMSNFRIISSLNISSYE
ncbi:MAG: hypothetical protein CVT93_04965 [Bacteroidetes bacterium HGW-Bacteroidetes-10]|nr:MAG: hypothetical protein CVT93_04965 [Bacteroidetes bacterium HGW-Bacteroidetes-10]